MYNLGTENGLKGTPGGQDLGQTTHPGVFRVPRCHTDTARWVGRVGGVGGLKARVSDLRLRPRFPFPPESYVDLHTRQSTVRFPQIHFPISMTKWSNIQRPDRQTKIRRTEGGVQRIDDDDDNNDDDDYDNYNQ